VSAKPGGLAGVLPFPSDDRGERAGTDDAEQKKGFELRRVLPVHAVQPGSGGRGPPAAAAVAAGDRLGDRRGRLRPRECHGELEAAIEALQGDGHHRLLPEVHPER
jgi:hypothetical protein